MTTRTLLLLRHAHTVDAIPGGRDIDRPLTAYGERQAREVGDHLRAQGIEPDAVLCSSAVRARQTCALLGLRADVTVEFCEAYYRAGTDDWIEALRILPDQIRLVLAIGHAPSLPGIAYDLADPYSSDPDAFATIESRFPPATLARLEFEGSWADLHSARLVSARLPSTGY